MSGDVVFIDSFSGSVSDLKPKQRGDMKKVLEVLSVDPRVSTWDMDDGKRYPLWKTIEKLKDAGYLEDVESHYPWLKYRLTESGKKFLSGDKSVESK